MNRMTRAQFLRLTASAAVCGAALLTGCGSGAAAPAADASSPAGTSAPEPSPTARPEPELLQPMGGSPLLYDVLQNALMEYADPCRAVPGYFSVQKNGLWGVIRADGSELIPCCAQSPFCQCSRGHWFSWGLDSSSPECATLGAALEQTGTDQLCPGHGLSDFNLFYDQNGLHITGWDGGGFVAEPDPALWELYGHSVLARPGVINYTIDSGYFATLCEGKVLLFHETTLCESDDLVFLDGGWFGSEALCPALLESGWCYIDEAGQMQGGGGLEPAFPDPTGELVRASDLLNGYAVICRDSKFGLFCAETCGTVVPCVYDGAAWDGTDLWLLQDGWHRYRISQA